MDSNQSNSKADTPPSPDSSSTNKFLFVNESTAKAGKKVGRRTDIKSHVRNHIVQREKKNKARDDQAASSALLNELNRSTTTSSKGKEREIRSTGRSQTSQAGVPIAEWNRASSASVPGTRESVSPLQFEEQAVPVSNPEASWYHLHAPSDQSQVISTPLPKPNIVSDVLERAISLTIGNTLESREFYQKYVLAPSRRKPQEFFSPRRSAGRSLLEGDFHTLAASQLRDCAICDDPNRRWMDCDQHGSAWERGEDIQEASNDGRIQQLVDAASKRQAFTSRPLDQLGTLSSGRNDPFTSFPSLVVDTTGTLNELFDHCKFSTSGFNFKAVY